MKQHANQRLGLRVQVQVKELDNMYFKLLQSDILKFCEQLYLGKTKTAVEILFKGTFLVFLNKTKCYSLKFVVVLSQK